MSKTPVKIAFGCREVEENTWTGTAFVYHKYSKNNYGTAVVYDNGREFANEESTYEDGSHSYHRFSKQGWQEMTSDDIEKTVGIVIDGNTLRSPLPPEISANEWYPKNSSSDSDETYENTKKEEQEPQDGYVDGMILEDIPEDIQAESDPETDEKQRDKSMEQQIQECLDATITSVITIELAETSTQNTPPKLEIENKPRPEIIPEISPIVTPTSPSKPYAKLLDNISETQQVRVLTCKPPPYIVHILFGAFVAGLIYISCKFYDRSEL